jgi:LacI family transcriptional regulator
VGLVVRGVSNPFYTDIIRTIESTITDAGFTMVMQQIGACDDEVKCGAVMEREKRLQGIIFLGGRSDYSPAELALLNVPFVCCRGARVRTHECWEYLMLNIIIIMV